MSSNGEIEILSDSTLRQLCGAEAYDELRTGLTFYDVWLELRAEQRERRMGNDFMFITRATVLGRWHQHKQELFDSTVEPALRSCSREKLIKLLQRNGEGVLASLLDSHEIP